mmetsp:Transcript_56085/g.76505  ORF Transcript_56085/g.76505 Transcript_56085/m.76505 type:complete len:294 (-) Transcript_56085:111-992(-)|eukprot:CAMPEP_0185790960 /NCGR_PEP_ID=MMETSP1174-20130828/158099_1 /TAXON_ID=35687 /ORGANISM="Dictyocha speculum, Strain CCMP1381" /LENGTH=293 /DNA_ID=CAMNT_0028485835 /DNA_START=1049 /DNA_END=1930 /DNA_ORIENTATION=-
MVGKQGKTGLNQRGKKKPRQNGLEIHLKVSAGTYPKNGPDFITWEKQRARDLKEQRRSSKTKGLKRKSTESPHAAKTSVTPNKQQDVINIDPDGSVETAEPIQDVINIDTGRPVETAEPIRQGAPKTSKKFAQARFGANGVLTTSKLNDGTDDGLRLLGLTPNGGTDEASLEKARKIKAAKSNAAKTKNGQLWSANPLCDCKSNGGKRLNSPMRGPLKSKTGTLYWVCQYKQVKREGPKDIPDGVKACMASFWGAQVPYTEPTKLRNLMLKTAFFNFADWKHAGFPRLREASS